MTCSGAVRLLGAALALLAFGCTRHEDGVSVEISVMHMPLRGDALRYPAGAERGFLTNLGYGVRMRTAYAVLARVELLRCGAPTGNAAPGGEDGAAGNGSDGHDHTHDHDEGARATPAGAGVDRLLATLRELLWPVAVAYAHGAEGPAAVNAPFVLDLMDEDGRALPLARLEPPATHYCKVRISFDAADEDAVGLPVTPTLLGSSLHVEGQYVEFSSETEHPFSMTAALPASVVVPLIDQRGQRAELALSARQRHAELRLELAYYAILDGIDLASTTADRAARGILQNLLRETRAVVVEP